MAKKEIYVSVDIEADGPIPGAFSMLNFGAAAFELGNEKPLATFEVNLSPLEGASQDPTTMEFWGRNPEAWAYVTKDPIPASQAIDQFQQWLKSLPGNPVLVTYPSWDYMWIRWYHVRFLGHTAAQTLGLAALDVKTLAMAAMKHPTFKNTSKRTMSKNHPEWFTGHPPHDHTGLSDAIGQGILFLRIMETLEGGDALPPVPSP